MCEASLKDLLDIIKVFHQNWKNIQKKKGLDVRSGLGIDQTNDYKGESLFIKSANNTKTERLPITLKDVTGIQNCFKFDVHQNINLKKTNK